MITGVKTLPFVLTFACLIYACSNQTQQKSAEQIKADSTRIADSILLAETPIKDPNSPKPMALMMRQMADNADSMKAQLKRGEVLDSLRYPFIRFYLVEPTDPSVLEPLFYDNARLFQRAWKNIFKQNSGQKKYYNLMINACVNCHKDYCNGPLKRINKLPLE